MTFELLSVPLQSGIRFFRLPLPAKLSANPTVGFPKGNTTGLPCSLYLVVRLGAYLNAEAIWITKR
ncbi:hypothetical protein EJD04_26120 [Salmonella enterica]|nr:hypothetical protein [Salmonella enterica]